MKIAKIIFTVLILSQITVFGVVTRNYSSARKGFYNNGTYNGIMLTEQGSLVLAPIIEKDGAIDGKFIWKIYPSADGSMYAAISGNGAELYRRKAGESDFNLFVKSTNESAFTSVISDNSGNIYAATGTYDRIIKYDNAGN